MADPRISLDGAPIPSADGEIHEYAYKEAVDSGQFDHRRKVVFVNGMKNSGKDHTESALALSWVQMCTVIGVYNKSHGAIADFMQCIGDKDQFNGPISFSASSKVLVGRVLGARTPVEAAVRALSRNPAQVTLFHLLRMPVNRSRDIFAHSQGNLILSNVLQAIEAVDGSESLRGYTVHTFGSPAYSWPRGLRKYESAFTWDPVTFLAGFDTTWTISKVGMPSGSANPITHGFLEYIKRDPAFIVNRFRWGGLGVTLNMDEQGLADALAAMGTNLRRVEAIFKHLNVKHNSDADDVAVRYVNAIKPSVATVEAIKKHSAFIDLLIQILDTGWTGNDEGQAIAFLRTLKV